MNLINDFVVIIMMTTIAVAKQVDYVFRSVSLAAAGSPGRPMDGHIVDVQWVLDHTEVETGDTFTLDMPDVFFAYAYSTGTSTFFYLNDTDGTSVASCNIDAGAGFTASSGTTINCVVIADFCQKELYSGIQRIGLKLNSGGRVETIPTALRWTTGTNTVTFNGNLSYDITFTAITSVDQYYQYGNGLHPDRFFLYFFIYDPCPGPAADGYNGAYTSATMTITVQGQTALQNDLTEMYYSDTMSSFQFPLDYHSIVKSQVISSDQKTTTINLGRAPALSKLWFSTYVKTLLSTPGFPTLTISYAGTFQCSNGKTAQLSASYPMYGNTPLINKPQTITVTTEIQPCTSIKFTTGSYSIVTEMHNNNPTYIPSCHTLTSTNTITTTWTGIYTSTYLTTGTDSSVTEIVEVPSSSVSSGGPDATLTTTWTGI